MEAELPGAVAEAEGTALVAEAILEVREPPRPLAEAAPALTPEEAAPATLEAPD